MEEEASFSLLPILLLLLLLALVAFLIFLGYQLAREKFSADREEFEVQRQVLDAEWMALENLQRVDEVVFQARLAMREAEADRSTPPRRPDPTVIDGEWW
jgi:cell division protein FtsL